MNTLNSKIHHFRTRIHSDRVRAMQWWNKLKGDKRQEITDFYFKKRKHSSLTVREIQEMFEKELAK